MTPSRPVFFLCLVLSASVGKKRKGNFLAKIGFSLSAIFLKSALFPLELPFPRSLPAFSRSKYALCRHHRRIKSPLFPTIDFPYFSVSFPFFIFLLYFSCAYFLPFRAFPKNAFSPSDLFCPCPCPCPCPSIISDSPQKNYAPSACCAYSS